MTAGRLVAEMDPRELLEWMALFKIEYEEKLQRELEMKAEAGLRKR